MRKNDPGKRKEKFHRFGNRYVSNMDDERDEYGWSQYPGQPFYLGYSNKPYRGSRRKWMLSGYYGHTYRKNRTGGA